VPAENRGDLERVGEFVGVFAPAHRALDQARDVKSLVPDASAVHLEQHDAGRVAANRRPDRKSQRMGRHRDLLDQRAQFREALRGLAHMGVDVAFRIGVAEAFLNDGDA
jgi:hypothetical protein